MKNSTQIMLMSMMIISTIMVMSSENWISMWMGLEINMMSFIPMMMKNKSKNSSESKMIYFLIQSMSSIMFLFIILINPMIMITEKLITNYSSIILTMSIAMKMGMAPLHFWFTEILKKMEWNTCAIMMTWQKLAPMSIMSYIINNNTMIILAVTSTIVGAIGGINQTSIQKIMGFSSVNHMGWMVMCMTLDSEMWIKYLIIYSMIIIMMMIMMKKNSTFFINQMNMYIKTPAEKLLYMSMFLSLGGLPPFIGFLPKWMTIQTMINTNMMTIMIIMIMMSMITLFYYMRMMSPMLMSFNTLNKWSMKKNNTINKNIMMMIIINLSLPLTSIMNML